MTTAALKKKKKHLIGVCLQFQKFSPLSSWQEAWQCTGQHGTWEGAERSTSCSTGRRRRLCVTLGVT